MKNITIGVISGILLLLIGGFLTKNVFNEKVDLRYTLSERIPSDFLKSNLMESIQQIEIKNNGEAQINKISIKIDCKINDFNVVKNSNADTMQVFPNSNNLEVFYSSLPPSGSIKIFLKSPDPGIKKSMLSITHEKGKAIESLDQESNISQVIILILMVCLSLWNFYTIITTENISHLESMVNYHPYERILKTKKPIYLKSEKWKEIRENAIERLYAHKPYAKEISESMEYKILNSQKPIEISEEEWREIIERSIYSLEERINDTINRFTFWENPYLLQLLEINKPLPILDTKWNKIRENIFAAYLNTLLKHLYEWERNFIYKDIKKPENLPEKYWETFIKKLNEKIFIELNNKIHFQYQYNTGKLEDEFAKILSDTLIENLDENQKKVLREKIYDMKFVSLVTSLLSNKETSVALPNKEKAEWINKYDYDLIIEIEKSKNLAKESEQIRDNLLQILHGIEIGDEKPIHISVKDWEKLKTIESQILDQKELIEEDKNLVLPLKDKIERQLSIINNIFEDPDSIYRIEDYANPFAVGNFKKLKMMSELIKKIGKEGIASSNDQKL